MQQVATVTQRIDDHRIGLAHMFAGHQRRALHEDTVASHRIGGFQAVALTDDIVVGAMAGRGMDDAGAGIQRDVLATDHRHGAIGKGVLRPHALQCGTGDTPACLALDPRPLQHAAGEFGRHHNGAPFTQAQPHVVQFRMDGQGLVGRQGPGRGRPDDEVHRCLLDTEGSRHRRRIGGRESHIHGRGALVGVFDLRFGQRGRAVQAPVHRLEAAHHVPVGNDIAQRPQLLGLEGRMHGQIGLIPVGEDAQALEVAALARDLLGGVGATLFAEGGGVELASDLAVLLLHLQFDGQTMAIPAGHEGGVVAIQSGGLDDDVLQNLVDRMADMDIAVGIGRAVDQQERGTVSRLLLNAGIEAFRLPARQPVRLALHQLGLHLEGRLREVEGCLVVGGLAHADSPKCARADLTSARICRESASSESKRCSARMNVSKSTVNSRP